MQSLLVCLAPPPPCPSPVPLPQSQPYSAIPAPGAHRPHRTPCLPKQHPAAITPSPSPPYPPPPPQPDSRSLQPSEPRRRRRHRHRPPPAARHRRARSALSTRIAASQLHRQGRPYRSAHHSLPKRVFRPSVWRFHGGLDTLNQNMARTTFDLAWRRRATNSGRVKGYMPRVPAGRGRMRRGMIQSDGR